MVSHNTFFKINIELDKKYFELMNKVKIPGFRPGKVPKIL